MNNKLAVLISVISLIISSISLSYDIIVKEYGLIIGNTEYYIRPSEKLLIENQLKGMSIAPITEIHNNGTVPIKINKVDSTRKCTTFPCSDFISQQRGQDKVLHQTLIEAHTTRHAGPPGGSLKLSD